MTDRGTSKSMSFWLQMFSLIALALIPLIVLRTLSGPPGVPTYTHIVGLIFISICVLGAIVGVRPSKFSRTKTQGGKAELQDLQESESIKQKPALQGHHYSCDQFSDHVLKIRSNVFCAGCTGLTTGAIISIYGGVLYFFVGISLFNEFLVFWLGFIGVFIGIAQHQLYRALPARSGFIRFILNIFFVVGAFLLLAGVNQIAGNLSLDIYVLCVILLWIFNRIMMSSSEHDRVCELCGIESCRHL